MTGSFKSLSGERESVRASRQSRTSLRLKNFAAMDPEEGRMADLEDDEELLDDHVWIQNSQNAYGAFIHVAIHHGLVSAILHCGPMLIIAFFVQSVFAMYLWFSCPSVADSLFCLIPQPLHMAAIGIYLTLMIQAVNRMYKASCVCLLAMEKRSAETADDVIFPVDVSYTTRSIIFVLAVLSNIFTWVSLTVVGIYFILTQNDVQMVLRSTVVMMFVQNVDEIAFDAGASKQIKSEVKCTLYKIKAFAADSYFNKDRVDTISQYYTLFGHLPFLVASSFALILGLQGVCHEDEPDVPLYCLSCPATAEALKSMIRQSPCTKCDDGTYPTESMNPSKMFAYA